MKKQLVVLSLTFLSIAAFAQNSNEEFKPSGEPQFRVYWNYHTDLSNNATKTSAFELNRAYLGYKYDFSNNISANVTLDVGTNSGGSSYTAFLKTAQLDWKIAPAVKLSMGLIGLKQFNDQEGFWGYRYLFASFQDANKFGHSADLGVNAEFTLSKTLKANVTLSNGEGFRNIQDQDGNQKLSGSLVYTPIKGLTTKIYMDSQPTEDSESIKTLSFFAGYDHSDWRIGAEYNKLSDGKSTSSPAVDHNLDGVSIYATYVINSKFEIFGRYDQLNSNTVVLADGAWNSAKNGSQLITGAQYAPIKGLKFSLNYQGYSFDDASKDNTSKVYLNAEFRL